MTEGGSPPLLQRLGRLLERVKLWAAYVALAFIFVVFYFGDFLGDELKNDLLPAALVLAAVSFIASLQVIEGTLAQRFSGFEGTLEGRFHGIEASLRRVEEQQEDWRISLPLLADAEQTGLQAIRPTAGQWAPPVPREVFVAAGMRIRYVQDRDFRSQLESVLRTGGEVTLVMSDPRSQRVWARYRDEPEALGKGNQMMELADLLRTVHQWCEELAAKGLDTHGLTVKLSEEYPLAAYYRVDQSICTYNYPYRFRGLDSPVYQFSISGPVGSRLCQFLQAVLDAAKPFDDAQYAEIDSWRQDGRLLDSVVLT